MDEEQYAVACDRYTGLRDNVRAIGLYIEEKRKMGNRPVRPGQDEFATARLPSGDDEDLVVASGRTEEPHEVLGVSPDAPDAVVTGAYRKLLKERHPDYGGSAAELRQLNQAKEAMLDG
jgi:DnaJ-domain-containing protein 1